MGASGGGTGGQFVFPYAAPDAAGSPTRWYTEMVQDVGAMILAAQAAASPYNGESVPDPDTYMGTSVTNTQKEINDHYTLLDAIDESSSYTTFMSDLVTEIASDFPAIDIASTVVSVHTAERTAVSPAMDAALTAAAAAIADTPISGLVTAFESRIQDQYLKAAARHVAMMADIGAVNSSAFVWGLSMVEVEFEKAVEEYSAKLDLEAFRDYMNLYMDTFKSTFHENVGNYAMLTANRNAKRDQMIISGASDLVRAYMWKHNANLDAAKLQTEANRIRYVAKAEEARDQLQIDVHDSLYDFELFAYGGNLLAAAGGAAQTPPHLSKMSSALSGAAAVGGIAAAIPGVGLPIVAGATLIGGIAGALS